MNEATFKHEMLKAKTFYEVGERSDYWSGYMRGLRRSYHGENFGTQKEHEKWSLLHLDEDSSRREKGKGYLDGLNLK